MDHHEITEEQMALNRETLREILTEQQEEDKHRHDPAWLSDHGLPFPLDRYGTKEDHDCF